MISNFDLPKDLPCQLIGITLYFNFLESILSGSSKKILKFSDTNGCNFCKVESYITQKCGGSCNGTARYCSKECQTRDWVQGHKRVCVA